MMFHALIKLAKFALFLVVGYLVISSAIDVFSTIEHFVARHIAAHLGVAGIGRSLGIIVVLALVSVAYVVVHGISNARLLHWIVPAAWIIAGLAAGWLAYRILLAGGDVWDIAGAVVGGGIVAQAMYLARRVHEQTSTPEDFFKLAWQMATQGAVTSTRYGAAVLLRAVDFRSAFMAHFGAKAPTGNALVSFDAVPIGAAFDHQTLAENDKLPRDIGGLARLLNGERDRVPEIIWFPTNKGHVTVVSGTRSAKTTALATPMALLYGGPMVINDLPAELYQRTARWRRENLGHKVVWFTPYQRTSSTFDPCEDVRIAIDECPAYAHGDRARQEHRMAVWSEVVDKGCFIPTWLSGEEGGKGGTEKFFDGNASGLIGVIFCMLAAFRMCRTSSESGAEIERMLQDKLTGSGEAAINISIETAREIVARRPEPNLVGLYEILTLGDKQLQLWLSVPAMHIIDDPYIARYIAQAKDIFASMDSRTWNSILATAINNMSLLKLPAMQHIFSGSRERDGDRFFSFTDFKSGRWTIYNSIYTTRDGQDLSAIGIIFLSIGNWLIKHSLNPKPVLLLDEAAKLRSNPWLMGNVGFVAKFMVIVFFYQDFGQIKEFWGDQEQSLFTNCALQLYSAQRHEDSIERIAKIVGKRTLSDKSYSVDTKNAGSQSVSEREADVLRPDEIRQLDERRLQIVNAPPVPCAVIGKLFYRDRPELVGRYDPTEYD